MLRSLIICFFSLPFALVNSQSAFRTVVPREPVVVGDAFQVQYIIEDLPVETFKPPVFTNFRLVSGPAFYKGMVEHLGSPRPLTNAVYTLEAIRPGKFTISGGTLQVGDKRIRSNSAIVTVLTVEEAAKKAEPASEYFLRPGEDPYKKIQENLFLKVTVDRESCYVGQPVQATFKLYSRLQSRSDIIKNPGFYGFTVFDQVSLSDRESSVEAIDGKLFDVHTIRKVQLFPLQSGTLYIDAMEIRNQVEFSKSAVNKKTEQEIVEGMSVFDDGNEHLNVGSEIYESEMHSEPVTISVKPLPDAGRPGNYQGAVGKFRIEALVNKDIGDPGRKGEVVLTIKGTGNLMQIDAPRPRWPSGMEVFQPTVRDDFDKASYPLEGERQFIYPFVVSRPAEFQIPEIFFSFFDPDSGKFRIATAVIEPFSMTRKKEAPQQAFRPSNEKRRSGSGLLILVAVLVAMVTAFFYFRSKSKKRIGDTTEIPTPGLVERLMQEPKKFVGRPDKEFYPVLGSAIRDFVKEKANLGSYGPGKNQLHELLRDRKVPGELIEELTGLIRTCEIGTFANAELRYDKGKLCDQAVVLLNKLERLL